MVWMVLSYCSISSGRQRGWQAHSWGSIVSVSLCYALKCTRLVNSQVRWFLCISMQLGGLDDDLFKERFVSFSLFFFFFFWLVFSVRLHAHQWNCSLELWGQEQLPKELLGAWWLLNKKSAVHSGHQGFNDRLGTKLIVFFYLWCLI